MSWMKRLLILLPGSPLENALEAKRRDAEMMSAEIQEMVEEATQLMERRFHTVLELGHADRRRRQRRAASR